MRPESLLELGVKCRSTEVRRKLDCSAHFWDHLYGCNQTFICEFRLLLQEQLILLIVSGVFGIWQLPSDQILVTFVAVCPSVPLFSTLMHNPNDLVQKLRDLSFEGLSNFDKAVNANNKEDRVDPVARNHNFKTAVTRANIFSNDNSAKLPKGHLQQVTDPKNSFLQFGSLHLVRIMFVVGNLGLVESWGLWLLQGIVSQCFDDWYHLGDWCNDNFLGIVLEEQCTCCQDDTSEDSCQELEHSSFLGLSCDSDSCIGY